MELRIFAFCCLIFLIAPKIQCMENDTEGCFNTCLNTTAITRCMYNRIGEKCYYRFYIQTDWEENRQLCIDHRLEMVRLSDETLDDIAKLQFEDRVDAYMWLGGKAEPKTEWMFVNDTAAVSQTSMVVGFEDYPSIWYHCGCLDTEDFSLKTDRCFAQKPFLCRFGNDIAAYKEGKTWSKARGRCLLDGGDLFYLRSDQYEAPFQEFTTLIKAAMAQSGIDTGTYLHIGVEHRSWHWLNGDPIVGSSDWLIDSYEENCVDVLYYGQWHEFLCGNTFMAFCQNVDPAFEMATTEYTTTEYTSTGTSSATPASSSVDAMTLETTPRETHTANSIWPIWTQGEEKSTTESKEGGISTPPSIVEGTNETILRALIATGTLMGVFFIGCVILAAILIMKITRDRRDKNAYVDPDSAMSNDAYIELDAVTSNNKNTYSEINLANLDTRKRKVEEPSQGHENGSIIAATSNGGNTYTALNVATLDSSKLAYEGPQVYVNCQVITGKPSEKTK